MSTKTATTTYIFRLLRINPDDICSPCADAEMLSKSDTKNGMIFFIKMTVKPLSLAEGFRVRIVIIFDCLFPMF